MHKCGRKKGKNIKRKIHFPFNWGLSKRLRLHSFMSIYAAEESQVKHEYTFRIKLQQC